MSDTPNSNFEKYRKYLAIVLSDGFVHRIISVYADSIEDAAAQIEVELTKNPSRQAYHDQWTRGGKLIVRAYELRGVGA